MRGSASDECSERPTYTVALFRGYVVPLDGLVALASTAHGVADAEPFVETCGLREREQCFGIESDYGHLGRICFAWPEGYVVATWRGASLVSQSFGRPTRRLAAGTWAIGNTLPCAWGRAGAQQRAPIPA